MTDTDLQPLVAATYVGLAELLQGMPEERWDAPSLCEAWRVREVVAHVTMPARYTEEQFMAELAEDEFDFTRSVEPHRQPRRPAPQRQAHRHPAGRRAAPVGAPGRRHRGRAQPRRDPLARRHRPSRRRSGRLRRGPPGGPRRAHHRWRSRALRHGHRRSQPPRRRTSTGFPSDPADPLSGTAADLAAHICGRALADGRLERHPPHPVVGPTRSNSRGRTRRRWCQSVLEVAMAWRTAVSSSGWP